MRLEWVQTDDIREIGSCGLHNMIREQFLRMEVLDRLVQ